MAKTTTAKTNAPHAAEPLKTGGRLNVGRKGMAKGSKKKY